MNELAVRRRVPSDPVTHVTPEAVAVELSWVVPTFPTTVPTAKTGGVGCGGGGGGGLVGVSPVAGKVTGGRGRGGGARDEVS